MLILIFLSTDYTDSFTALCNLWMDIFAGQQFHVLNDDAYRNRPVIRPGIEKMDLSIAHVFYCFSSLDQSESSVLVSAGFKSHRPVNN